MAYQTQTLDLFPDEAKVEQDYTATFADNMKMPIHKWYRYTAGFSAAWVSELIKKKVRMDEQELLTHLQVQELF
jgi:hypothetical protein